MQDRQAELEAELQLRFLAALVAVQSTASSSTAPTATTASAAWELLRRHYNEAHRTYHTLHHLQAMLANLDARYNQAGMGSPPAASVLAVFYHDAIYQTQEAAPGANEEQSSVLAEQQLTGLGVQQQTVALVAAYVRATYHFAASATHDSSSSNDPHLLAFLDADLSTLGAARMDYQAYAAGIRKEYCHIPQPDYIRGRSAVLSALLSKPRLFLSDWTDPSAEAAARANMEWELQQLAGNAAQPAAEVV